jgi:prepilin-type N-terminal cleavage/methylation domain-containing protein
MSDERGMTLVELMIAMAVGFVVLFATFALVEVSARNSARIAHRVDLNQRVRPVMQHVMDELHSACVAPGIAPVLEGSTPSSLNFLHQTGSGVSPTPDRRVISLSGTTLSESLYAGVGGSGPDDWTFATTPSTRVLLADVEPAHLGDPPTDAPLFRYWAYEPGETTLAEVSTPLTEESAETVVQVDVAFSVDPSRNPTNDPNDAVSVADSVLLRFEPAQGGTTEGNGPCV